MKKLTFIIFTLLGIPALFGMDTGQNVFRSTVRSLQVSNPNNFMGPPVIRLGSNEKLNINFDIIGEDSEYLRFRLIHCNSDWQPSRLMENEYLGNFNDATIDDYAYSNNTYVHYVNYNIEIPSPQLPILRSGNYLLQVYPEHDPDEIILQARFAVSEGITPVNAGLTTRTDKGFNSEFQQLFFNADLSALPNVNPYQDLIITITQNNRPETVRVLKHPMRVTDKKAVFEHSPELIFEAGNEYRRFETVRTDYPGMHIDKVDFQNGMWNAWLQQDSSRKHRQYVYDNTQHGRFKIDDYNSTDPDLGADYVLVHFSLDPGERQYGEIYLDGDFTNHTYTESNLMRYDWNDGLYHASIPLKQGSYNYQYVVKTDKEKVPLPASIEGNKYETNNEYLIQVFLRTPGSRADRLIGSTLLSNL